MFIDNLKCNWLTVKWSSKLNVQNVVLTSPGNENVYVNSENNDLYCQRYKI